MLIQTFSYSPPFSKGCFHCQRICVYAALSSFLDASISEVACWLTKSRHGEEARGKLSETTRNKEVFLIIMVALLKWTFLTDWKHWNRQHVWVFFYVSMKNCCYGSSEVTCPSWLYSSLFNNIPGHVAWPSKNRIKWWKQSCMRGHESWDWWKLWWLSNYSGGSDSIISTNDWQSSFWPPVALPRVYLRGHF